MITVRKVLNSDASDILNDSELKVIPYPGTLEIYAASSQNDTNVTIFKNDQIVVFSKPIQQRTGGVVDTIADTPFELQVSDGENVRIDIDINTAATCTVEANLRSYDEWNEKF